MLIKRLPVEAKLDFMSLRMFCFALSAVAILASIFLIPTRGLNFGIDFAGGTLVEISEPTNQEIGEQDIRDALAPLNLDDLAVTSATGTGTDAKGIFVIKSASSDDTAVDAENLEANASSTMDASDRIVERLAEVFPQGDADNPSWEILRKENVGPKVSGELLRAGVTALVVALGFMLIYIWFRFEWQFSIGAVMALAHDVILTIGVFSLLQIDFNLTTIAALLTIIGYSMNDTVVVYDRVREELRRYKKMPIKDVINLSLNRTLTRTTLTSGTTLLALISIYVLGGEVLRGFSFALIWGVIVGTYSSIFVASALLLHTGLKRERKDLPNAEERFST